jgi:hypothetical protein
MDLEKFAEEEEDARRWGACTSVVVAIVIERKADGTVDWVVKKYELARGPEVAREALKRLAADFPETPSPSDLFVLAGYKALDLVGVRLPVLRNQTVLGPHVPVSGTPLYDVLKSYVNETKAINLLESNHLKETKFALGRENYDPKNSLAALLASLQIGKKLESDGSHAIRLVNENKLDKLLQYCYVDTVALIFVLQYLHRVNPWSLKVAMCDDKKLLEPTKINNSTMRALIEVTYNDNELSKFAPVDSRIMKALLKTPVPLMPWVEGEAKKFHEEFYQKIEAMDANFAASGLRGEVGGVGGSRQ